MKGFESAPGLHAKVHLKNAVAAMEGIVWFATPEGLSFTKLPIVYRYGEDEARDKAEAYLWKDIESVTPV